MSDWQPVWDANSKKYYYWNKNTQETSWINKTGLATPDPPTVEQAKGSKQKAADTLALKSGKISENEQIPNQEEISDYYSSKEYYEWYMNVVKEHQVQQSANQTAASYAAAQKTDRFAELAMIPGASGVDSTLQAASRECKQMSYFFDVEKYHQERALDRMAPKVGKKYTRKEIEKFKQKKHEKKVNSLLQRMGPDN